VLCKTGGGIKPGELLHIPKQASRSHLEFNDILKNEILDFSDNNISINQK
jgi:hypothetical protein